MNSLREYWEDKDKRRGILVTAIVHLALFLIFLFFGLTYYEPKPEDGIVINFGYSETGAGTLENTGSPPTTPQPEQTEQTDNNTETSETENPMQTQDAIDAPAVEANKTKQQEKTEPQDKPVEEPKPSDELSDLLNQVENTQNGGEGVTSGAGDQGDPTGDPNSPNRTGGGGGGNGGGNYLLGNRKALEKPKPSYDCPDQGRVVVKIYVDRNGKVSRAVPGERIPGGAASTTTSSCLYAKAKSAALNTTWQGDPEAPTLQSGYIIYNFSKN